MDGGDRREGQGLERIEYALAEGDVLERIGRGGEPGEFADVRPGDEAGTLGRADDDAAQCVGPQRAQLRTELAQRRVRERVGGAAGLVEAQPADLAGIDLEAPGSRRSGGSLAHERGFPLVELTLKSHTSGR